MPSPTISVIVPVYQVEKYIAECIESILVQRFADFELLLINDGTKDKSFDICKQYAEQDQRIVLIEQSNQGVSAARNKGITHAQGIYIAFVDSDDIIKPEALERHHQTIVEQDVDLVMSKIYRFDNRDHCSYYPALENERIDHAGLFDYILHRMGKKNPSKKFEQVYCFGFSSCLYKRNIIEQNAIQFPNFRIGEDLYFLNDYSINAQSAYILNEDLYGYRINPQSVMGNHIPNCFDDVIIRRNYYLEFQKKYQLINNQDFCYSMNRSHAARLHGCVVNLLTAHNNKSSTFRYPNIKKELHQIIHELAPIATFLKPDDKKRIQRIKLIIGSYVLYQLYIAAVYLKNKLVK